MMAKETTHICDGCGAKHYGDDFPAMWKRIIVRIEKESDRDLATERVASGTYDLCGTCTDLLVERANPASWPRATVSANA
jgi:hypothetical protein